MEGEAAGERKVVVGGGEVVRQEESGRERKGGSEVGSEARRGGMRSMNLYVFYAGYD